MAVRVGHRVVCADDYKVCLALKMQLIAVEKRGVSKRTVEVVLPTADAYSTELEPCPSPTRIASSSERENLPSPLARPRAAHPRCHYLSRACHPCSFPCGAGHQVLFVAGCQSEEAGDNDDEVDEGDTGHAHAFGWSATLVRVSPAPSHPVVLIASLHTPGPHLFSVVGQSQVAGCHSTDDLTYPMSSYSAADAHVRLRRGCV